MINKNSACGRCISVWVIAVAFAATARPQSITSTTAAEQSSDTGGLEAIVVTAERRQEDVQKVPIAISVIAPEQIQDFSITKVNDIDLVTSGLTMHNSDSALQPYIRGIGTTSALAGLEPAVATYIDGAYLPQAEGVITDMFDMASVEVLKGAQGTLWGSNASGGAILYNSANPVMNEFFMNVTAEYGKYDHGLGELVANIPLNDTLAVRLAVHGTTTGGYVTDLTNDEKLDWHRNVSARGKIKWEPNDSFNAVLTIEHYDTNDGNDFRTLRSGAPLCPLCAAGLAVPAAGFYTTTVNSVSYDGSESSFHNTESAQNLELNYSASWFDVSSMTSYRQNLTAGSIDVANTIIPLFNFYTVALGRTFEQETQWTTTAREMINGTIGLSYLHDTSTFDGAYLGPAFAPIPGAPPVHNDEVETSTHALFGELYLTPIDKLKITLGARYTGNSRTLFATQNSAASIAFSGAPATPLLGFTENANFSQVTPRVVVAYDFDPVNVYASYNKGFKAGGFSTPALAAVVNGAVALPMPIQSETVDDYELGAKYVSADRRLKVDQSIFFYRYSNIQVDVDNSAAAPTIQNAASARGYGADLDSSYQIVEALKVIGDLAYLQTKYTSFPEASVSIVAPDGSLANGSENLTGHRLPNAPTLSGSLGFNLKTPLSSGFLADLNAVAHYTNGYDLQPGGGGPLGYAVQPSYTELNISGYIEPKVLQNGTAFLGLKDYKIGFYVTNATDRQFYNGRFMITGTFGGLVDQVAQPRMFGLRVSASF